MNEDFVLRQDVTVIPSSGKCLLNWVVYETIGECLINDNVLHDYPLVVRWMRDWRPLAFIYRFLRVKNAPGVTYHTPRWLAAVAGYAPLDVFSDAVWYWMGKPGENNGSLLREMK